MKQDQEAPTPVKEEAVPVLPPKGRPVTDLVPGAFAESLMRNNRKIREDRALQIAEDAQMIYKRQIEDLQLEIKRLRREREGMLDLSPTTADSLVLASDFNATGFVSKDIELGVKIRNLEIKLEIATTRYSILFGNL